MPLKGVLAIFQKTLRNGGRGTEYRAGGGRRRLRLIAVSFGLALLSLFLYFHYFIFISRKKKSRRCRSLVFGMLRTGFEFP